MGIEIERKFLVSDDSWKSLASPELYKQAYLSLEPKRTVRVRIVGDRGWLTVKGENFGTTRPEFEYVIPKTDADKMISQLCLSPYIEKNRYVIPQGKHTWEVDEFLGSNLGLVVAEIELSKENETFEIPSWIGDEVTEQKKYYNSSLIKLPFSKW